MGIKLNKELNTYVVSYSKRHPVTRRPYSARRIGIQTKAKANRVLAELIIQVERKIHETVMPSWPTLVAEYIEDLSGRDVSIKTVDSYRLCLEAHTCSEWEERLIDSITAQEIRELIKAKVGHRSASHQKNVLKYIRGAFTFAVDKAYLNRNPTPAMKFQIGNKIKKSLTEEQVNILLTQAKLVDSRWYTIWCAALYTGMRNGELYALTWDKVNLETSKILVDSSWNNKDGFKDTKSGDDRIVEIAPNLLIILKELKLRNLNPPFVLPRIGKWDKGRQAEDLRMFLEGCSLPSIRFHDLRATWATIMLSKGIAPIKVMAMGGWKDLKTMQIYIRKAGVNVNGITDNLNLHCVSLKTNILAMS